MGTAKNIKSQFIHIDGTFVERANGNPYRNYITFRIAFGILKMNVRSMDGVKTNSTSVFR